MRKQILCILLILIVLFISGCAGLFGNCIVGSGNVVSKEYAVTEFHSVAIAGSGNLYVTQGEPHSLIIEAEDNVIEQLEVNVANRKLSIRSKKCFTNIKPINIYVTMKDVQDLAGSGSVNMFGRTDINTDKLGLSISGSGTFDLTLYAQELNTRISGSGKPKLRGTAHVHNVMVSGSAKIKAFDLATHETNIIISGSGNAEVDASEKLDVTISGSGNVYYTGDAAVTQSVSGSGKIQKV